MRYPTSFPMQGPDVRGILSPRELLICIGAALGLQAAAIPFVNLPDAPNAQHKLESRGLTVQNIQRGITFGRPQCKGLYATQFQVATARGEIRKGVVCRNAFSTDQTINFDPQ